MEIDKEQQLMQQVWAILGPMEMMPRARLINYVNSLHTQEANENQQKLNAALGSPTGGQLPPGQAPPLQ